MRSLRDALFFKNNIHFFTAILMDAAFEGNLLRIILDLCKKQRKILTLNLWSFWNERNFLSMEFSNIKIHDDFEIDKMNLNKKILPGSRKNSLMR
jgi:hypothetical protein